MTYPTPVEERRIAAHSSILQESPSKRHFQHSFFCQASLPYRVTDDQRSWFRKAGNLELHVQAGFAPVKREMVPVPLPSGPKARLLLIHMMTEAVVSGSRKISLQNNLTRFARSVGIDTNGRNLRQLRDHLMRLACCTIRFVKTTGRYTEIVQGHIAESFKVFHAERRSRQWCSEILLSEAFYDSLIKHAVPLDPRALASLKHSASCLDTYLWLAQRLWHIDAPVVVPWKALHGQLGGSTVRCASWKQQWLGRNKASCGTLPQVLQVYPAAKDAVEATEKGLLLRRAKPPVSRFTT